MSANHLWSFVKRLKVSLRLLTKTPYVEPLMPDRMGDTDANWARQDEARSSDSDGMQRETKLRGNDGDHGDGGLLRVGVMDTERRPNYNRAKNSALKILREKGLDQPPIDPASIAESMGVAVYFVSFDPADSNISGFYDPDESAIYVNEDEAPVRQNFTIAHELGHHVLHREWARTNDYVMLCRDQNANNEVAEEREANVFAANLLVPRKILDEFVGNLSEAELSRLFAVSIPTIKNRLRFEYDLG